jgi:hypothetical protein
MEIEYIFDEYESFPTYEQDSIVFDGLPNELMRVVIISIPHYLAQ